MAPEDACSTEMLVLIRWHGRVMAVHCPNSRLLDPATPPRGRWRLALLGGERLSFLIFQSDSPQLRTLTENSRTTSTIV